MSNHNYKWFPLITALFVTTLIISNIIAVKLVNIFGLLLPAAVILFPITYIVGDVLTEVYGFGQARRVIWIGFFCNFVAVVAIWLAGQLQPAPFWSTPFYETPGEAETAFQAILGFAPRLLMASFAAYLIGEFLNSFVLAKMKLLTKGRFLWTRTIGSTIVGQGTDAAVFITIAFMGILPTNGLITAILSQWLFKVAYETLATPLTYLVVYSLKRSERVDVYDHETSFNPFRVRTQQGTASE